MRARGVMPDEVTYSSAITACGNAGQAKRAIALLRVRTECHLRRSGVPRRVHRVLYVVHVSEPRDLAVHNRNFLS